MFKVIIAGSRSFDNYPLMERTIGSILMNKMEFGLENCGIEIVSGNAKGADKSGERYAREHNYGLKLFPSEWENLSATPCVIVEKNGRKYNKLAGMNRNRDMRDYSDALVAFWDGVSTGTKAMIDMAKEKGLLVRIIRTDVANIFNGNLLDEEYGVIIHQVNNKHKMGSGIAKQIREKYSQHYTDYMNNSLKLGTCISTKIRSGFGICGFVGQDGYGTDKQYTDYKAFESCLKTVAKWHKANADVPFYMPYNIGCGLAGGDWKVIYKMICDITPFVMIIKYEGVI